MSAPSRRTGSLLLLWLLGWGVATSGVVAAPVPLHVVGNHLEDSAGHRVRLQGVNLPSLEWSEAGDHLFESLDVAMEGWGARLIRLPLSQDFWAGQARGARSREAADAYHTRVDRVVRRAADRGSYVVIDLHWSDGGVWGEHVGQHAMPDDNSLLFWKEAAARYANNPAVLFDLYNEPHDVSWEVWRGGGMVQERNSDPSRGLSLSYHSPGMQALLDAVRGTGARNLVVAGGLNWAYDLRGIVEGHALADPKGQGVLYATHLYPWKKDWDVHVTPVIAKYPVFVGEAGTKPWKPGDPPHENVYTESWAPRVIDYIEGHQLSWTAWSFHPGASPCLISGWDYTPTPYWGALVKSALAKPAQGVRPPPGAR